MSVVVLMSTYTFLFFFAFQLFVHISVSTNTVHEKIASPVLVGSLLCVCVCVCVCVCAPVTFVHWCMKHHACFFPLSADAV